MRAAQHYTVPSRPRRELSPAQYGVLAAWLRELENAQPVERPMLAIRARVDFGGWPLIICSTCEARKAHEPGSIRHRMTISGVIDHYRRAFGYVHELVIDDDAVRVIA